jgi:4-amino-4-deoxy-L-arabinose transferase-like glycosyltransferase
MPVLFLALAANSIWDANEAFYVETPHQMVVTGDYLNPTFNGLPRFNKPVLSYWVVAGFYKAFGVSVGVERVTIALGALGILVGAYFIGRALRSRATGALAALLLVTAPRFVFFARRIFIDIYLALFMTLALACFALAERHPEHRRRYLLLMYVALGLGVLTKGPIALVIPAIAALAWLAAERRLGDILKLMLPAGALVVAVIVVPWYAAIYAQHGWEYIRFFFVDENLGRYANPLTTERSPLFFVFVLLGDILLPWALLVAIPMLTAWRRTAPVDAAGSIRRLLWWWVAATLVVFSFSASKEDLYILPAIPAAAVLIADLLASSFYGATHRGVRAVLWAAAGLVVVLAALVGAYFTSGHYAIAGATLLAGVLGATGVTALALLWRRAPAAAFAILAAGFILFNYLFVLRALPDVERLKPSPPLAQVVADRASPAAALASFNIELPSFVFYAGRPVERLFDADQAARFFANHGDAWMLVGEGEWSDLRPRLPAACVAARHPLFLSKGSDILRGQPPPDVLLITNNCK